MNETLEYLQTFARFPFALRRFLQHRLTLDEAKQIVRERMEHREENFLRMLERNVYGNPHSPYLKLLKHAGCELSDVHTLVKQKEIEGALKDLRAAGVYVTFEEFKGRKPIIRGGLSVSVSSDDFNNHPAPYTFAAESGGSTGAGTRVVQNLDQLAASTPHELVTCSTWGITDAPNIVWRGILPDSTLNQILRLVFSESPPHHWFSNLGLTDSKHWIKYALATYYTLIWLRLYGARVPFPEFVSVNQPQVIVRAIGELLKSKGTCVLRTVVSRGLRVSLAAEEMGINLEGLTIRAGGEACTPAKVRAIQRSGARFVPSYGMTETGTLGNGCAHSLHSDEIHLFKDAFACIGYPHHLPGFDLTVPALNLTTLSSSAPKVLLNFQADDYGIIEERHCGCEFETYGYTTLLREIRSYSKLTGEGVTLIGNEIQEILEQSLPSRFGGNLADYQLMEEEDSRGLTRLSLVISPRIQIEDEQVVIQYFLKALKESSSMGDAARVVWQSAQTIQIKRIEPLWTKRGKLLPLHLVRHENPK